MNSCTFYIVFVYVMKGAYMVHYLSLNKVTSPRVQLFMSFTIIGIAVGAFVSLLSTAFYCWPINLHWYDLGTSPSA